LGGGVEHNPVNDDRALLLQARTSALATLQTACAPAHRAALEQRIAELDARLAGLAEASATKTVR
jgi:hypothetical protein